MSSESTYVVNVKTTIGTIVTVRGDTAQALVDNINAFEQTGAALAISALEGLVAGKPVAPTPQAVAAAIGGTVVEEKFAPVTPAPAATSAGSRTCKHGVMVLRSGISQKSGKPYTGYFCPSPKGTPDQCEPQFSR
jgi:hypothetical protein